MSGTNNSIESWVTVPTNSTLTIHKQTVMVHPIIDEYYSYNPYHSRSSKFVQDKGLVTNEKQPSPAGTPGMTKENKKHLGPSNLHETIAQNLSPQMHAPTALHEPLSRSTTPASGASPNRSRELSPIADIRQLSSLTDISVTPHKPQEQGNIKKKRSRTVGGPPQIATNGHPHQPSAQDNEPPSPSSPESRNGFGDPAKIAQFFPELHPH